MFDIEKLVNGLDGKNCQNTNIEEIGVGLLVGGIISARWRRFVAKSVDNENSRRRTAL
jgi:hypothetical protein